jgi:hypothetical protein
MLGDAPLEAPAGDRQLAAIERRDAAGCTSTARRERMFDGIENVARVIVIVKSEP